MTVESGDEEFQAGSKRDLVAAARNALKLGGSLMATWAVALVVRFHLPRHLGPESFGAYNFSESFAGAFSIFVGLGVETYIQKEISVRPEHATDFFGGVVVLRALLSTILLTAMAGVLVVTHRPMETVYVAIVFGVAQFLASLNDLLGMIGRAAGTTLTATYEPARAGDIRASLADISRARSVLGYVPKVSVEEGLARLVAHVKRERGATAP